jgi:hypothetical protein
MFLDQILSTSKKHNVDEVMISLGVAGTTGIMEAWELLQKFYSGVSLQVLQNFLLYDMVSVYLKVLSQQHSM